MPPHMRIPNHAPLDNLVALARRPGRDGLPDDGAVGAEAELFAVAGAGHAAAGT